MSIGEAGKDQVRGASSTACSESQVLETYDEAFLRSWDLQMTSLRFEPLAIWHSCSAW